MSHQQKFKEFTLEAQVKDNLRNRIAFGQSKLQAKLTGEYLNKIYSKSTYESYYKWGVDFVKYCRSQDTSLKDLSQCRKYVQQYIDAHLDQSAWTLKLKASALAKIYDMSKMGDNNQIVHSSDYPQTPCRKRENITRSRNEVEHDKCFSERKNKVLVDFCKSTGLRRSELKSLKGNQLICNADGSYSLKVTGKGGRTRILPVINEVELVVGLCQKNASKRVFEHVPAHMDVHSYRAEYCTDVYKMHERPLNELTSKEIYSCRSDRKGVKFDKQAMLIASQALGHNRINIIASNYLRV